MRRCKSSDPCAPGTPVFSAARAPGRSCAQDTRDGLPIYPARSGLLLRNCAPPAFLIRKKRALIENMYIHMQMWDLHIASSFSEPSADLVKHLTMRGREMGRDGWSEIFRVRLWGRLTRRFGIRGSIVRRFKFAGCMFVEILAGKSGGIATNFMSSGPSLSKTFLIEEAKHLRLSEKTKTVLLQVTDVVVKKQKQFSQWGSKTASSMREQNSFLCEEAKQLPQWRSKSLRFLNGKAKTQLPRYGSLRYEEAKPSLRKQKHPTSKIP